MFVHCIVERLKQLSIFLLSVRYLHAIWMAWYGGINLGSFRKWELLWLILLFLIWETKKTLYWRSLSLKLLTENWEMIKSFVGKFHTWSIVFHISINPLFLEYRSPGSKPSPCLIKFNFDASFKKNRGSIAMITRDHFDNIIGIWCKLLQIIKF